MRLSFAFRLTSYLLALSGFLSLILTGDLPPLIVIPALLAFLINMVQLLTGGEAIFSKRTWYGMTLIVFFLFIIDTLWISRSILHSTTHFLTFLMINKLFNLSTAKDYLQLYLISFLQLLAASGFSPSLSYAFSFIVYLILTVWTLILYHLHWEMEEQGKSPLPARPSGLLKRSWSLQAAQKAPDSANQGIETIINLPFFTATNIVAVGAFTLALLIFFLIPRVGTGMFQRSTTETIKVSGFSQTVRLGTIGPVKLDPTVIMRVVLLQNQERAKGPLYLRGTAFDLYDGYAWKNSLSARQSLPQNQEGYFLLSPQNPLEQGIQQEIISEPLDTPILFGFSQVTAIRGRFPSLSIDTMNTISLPFSPPARFSYTVISFLPYPSQYDLSTDRPSIPLPIHELYLQLPNGMDRIRRLAEDVTRQSKSNYQRVKAIEGFLQTNYRYTLDIPPSSVDDPIEEFLFQRKSGYCEHYATAMVLMARTQGIPARMASGFLPNEWNDYGKYFTVRQRDAHTWVEVYFPESGWITFDPTPAVGNASGSPLFSTLASYIDALRLKWDRYIINYSFRDQATLVNNLRENAQNLRERTDRFLGSLRATFQFFKVLIHEKGLLYPLLTLLVILILTASFYRLRKRGKREAARQIGKDLTVERGKKAVHFYMQMLRMLERQGMIKARHLTPTEFLTEVRILASPLYQETTEITRIYHQVRFGHLPLSPQEEEKVQELLTNLRKLAETRQAAQADAETEVGPRQG